MLFDVDGTLVRTGGVGPAAIEDAIQAVLGRPATVEVTMAGKTDPQIVREYLDLMHEDHSHSPAILEQLEKELAAAADQIVAAGGVLPGVAELLEALHDDQRVVSTVLTGNIAPNAVVKLAAFGLDRWLDLEVGAYGSDDADRRLLVPVVRRRLAERLELEGEISLDDTWVVGDTPRDLECARVGGAHCLLVGTGAWPAADLAGLGADEVLDDLADKARVLRILLS